MQDSTAGSGGGGGSGANELTRVGGGLARFRSAPATWLDALLEDDDPLKLGSQHHGGLTQLLTSAAGPGPSGRSSGSGPSQAYIQTPADPGFFEGGGGESGSQLNSGFYRMNSSPAEFLTGSVEGYFSSFGLPSSYDYMGSSLDVSSSGKRLREGDIEQQSPNFAPHRRADQGGQLSASSGGSLLDMEMEKLLEDTVPCRVRAKRGFATHPRSIAERVRRTRISDRIRKLQELVPNMDKQTNTADMLEEAVEYVKHLQKQIQELTEQQKKCKCIAKS